MALAEMGIPRKTWPKILRLTAEYTGKTKTKRPKKEILDELNCLLGEKSPEFYLALREFISKGKFFAKIMAKEGATLTQEKLDTLFKDFLGDRKR